jgi:DME family drug/metabolite transporter
MSTSVAPARTRAGVSYLVLSGILWGTGGLTGTLLRHATGLSPIAVAAYRLAVGGALIVLFLAGTGRPLPRGRAAWTRVAVIGLLAAGFQASYFAAVACTSVSLATLVTIGMSPALVLVAERVIVGRHLGRTSKAAVTGRRRVDRWMLATLGLALAGLGLLVGLPSGGFSAGAVLASTALAVLAASGFATVTLVGSRPVPGLDELTTTGLGFTAGGLLLLPLAGATAGLGFHVAAGSVALVLALGTGPTAVAYTLYFRGLRTVAAGTAAVMALLEPLTGAVLAALLLHDRLGPAGIAGAALLGAAVLLAAKRPDGSG